ncbi:MAG: helix-turn-helix transcriptional regulator [Corynebacterium glucuronolyticum]|nr:helix-turn-helix transcriptional regulator [Mycobacteriaceae bacterium]MDY5834651.1 helix-turn-helix transcriptional regulator [Corynebacterium glucuronolyticum]
MATVKTIRARSEWVEELLDKYGTVSAVAKEMGVDKSTVSRWLSGGKEASPRFIAATLFSFPVTFDDAFVAVEEVAERRKARVYVKATGQVA